MSTLSRFAVKVPCPRCGAADGEWCVKNSGKHAAFLHRPRLDPFESLSNLSYQIGYTHGQKAARRAFTQK